MLDIGYESDSDDKSLTYVVVDLVQLGKEPQLGGVVPRTYGGGEGESDTGAGAGAAAASGAADADADADVAVDADAAHAGKEEEEKEEEEEVEEEEVTNAKWEVVCDKINARVEATLPGKKSGTVVCSGDVIEVCHQRLFLFVCFRIILLDSSAYFVYLYCMFPTRTYGMIFDFV